MAHLHLMLSPSNEYDSFPGSLGYLTIEIIDSKLQRLRVAVEQ